MVSYKNYDERKANIMKWLPTFLKENYNEKRMGHLLERHINIDDQSLIKRVVKEGKYSATSFYGDEKTIIAALNGVLISNADEIASFLADDGCEMWVIEDEMPAEISGSGYFRSKEHDWNEGAKECTIVRIAIKKRANCNEPFICSIYPTI